MKIECCQCTREYLMEGNLYEPSPATSYPLLVCPYCGFQHILSFLPVPQHRVNERSPVPPPPKLLTNLKLGPYYPTLFASRIADDQKVDKSGADDVDVTDWDPGADFILATMVGTDKGTLVRALRLQWRVLPAGGFADVLSTGAINFTASTVLVNQNIVTGRICSDVSGYTTGNGFQSEGDNLAPDTGGWNFTDDDAYEFQWALSPSGCDYETEYELRVIDDTEEVAIGTCLASLTMGSEPALILDATRIANATRVDQSTDDDFDVIDWNPADDFILALCISNLSASALTRAVKLQWRNVSEAGSFADVASTGEISFTADTDLVDGNDVLTGERLCNSPPSVDWEDGLESEGDNLLPDSSTFSYTSDYFTEHHFALDCSSALYGDEYEFRLYDVTDASIVAVCVATLTMATEVALTLDACRFANATRVDQSGSDDGDVSGWDQDDDFILATCLSNVGAYTAARSLRLQWRNVTDSGSFNDVSTTGEIRYTAVTDLVDGNALLTGERLCDSPSGPAWEDGLECEGDNTVPSTGQHTYTEDYFTEHQFALDCSTAPYSKEYEFRLIDEQLGLPVAVCVPTITMIADPAGGCPRQMMHYALRRRA